MNGFTSSSATEETTEKSSWLFLEIDWLFQAIVVNPSPKLTDQENSSIVIFLGLLININVLKLTQR